MQTKRNLPYTVLRLCYSSKLRKRFHVVRAGCGKRVADAESNSDPRVLKAMSKKLYNSQGPGERTINAAL